MRRRRFLAAAVAAVTTVSLAGTARAQMPDARSMSGVPLPVAELPAGAVSIRVVRDGLANPLGDQKVTLEGGGRSETLVTDADGRVQFAGFPVGAVVRGSVVVDGRAVDSSPFEIPAAGGIRLLLVVSSVAEAPSTGAAASGAAAGGQMTTGGAARPSGPGEVVFGGDTRVVVQFDDDQLEVFYLLEVVNGGAAPASPGPLVFDLPPGASSVALLEGSTPQAEVSGRRVTIRGPFAPGRTSLQVAFYLPASGDKLVISQSFPAMLQQLALFVQKVPGVRLASTQVGDQREMPAEGRTFVSAVGPAVKAGAPFSFELSGLPHRPTWPRNLALSLALLVAVLGAWGAARTGGGVSERARLDARRERLFAEVLAVDRRERSGEVDPTAAAAARARALSELERIYGALDVEAPAASASRGGPA